MNQWLYTIRERCTPETLEGWEEYLAFSGFKHITELVTLDSIMCPDIITDLVDEDWSHNLQEDCRITFFRDSEYLMDRQPLDPSRHQLLAILECPDRSKSVPPGFTRCGFDIMDSYLGNSTLTNCGPIPEAIDPSAVNTFGLLSDGETAIEVRDKMRRQRPVDPHLGDCEVWLIARRLPDG
ncbi:MAG: hypothetical protein ACYC6N_00920 [Pirellulaceae bacterium]